jgi:hypothetical protein
MGEHHMAKKRTPYQPSVEEPEHRTIKLGKRKMPGERTAIENFVNETRRRLDSDKVFLNSLVGNPMSQAVKELSPILSKTVPIEEVLAELKSAGFTRAARTKSGSWVYLKPEHVEEFLQENQKEKPQQQKRRLTSID